ncbi:MSMEG_1061 family FMN-dependent PPOX-type flavoprotein [Janthinobacterium sp. J1-1]|uniref:MSMEG_1061 family FMN-dependent PPOX-type flavoprotein n=1 Tax=Janthinobacterium sp. J1-1 TaxID=3065910 RepID=UPI0028122F1C|nr:MSMEG_1061 family FMN-dependent PPOX-type flavoprotein [Janthinobacterium sp. J1-1]
MTNVNLSELYAPPSDMIVKAVLDHLLPFHLSYLKAATFFCLASGSADGLDASPRGGAAGFVHALDNKTVAFADWPGNNRIASLTNLQSDDRIGMLFLFPGLEIFMRINGHAAMSMHPELLRALAEGARLPKTAIVVKIDEVLFHCGKAINRAKLWHPDSMLDRKSLPSPGEIVAAITGADSATAQAMNEGYYTAIRGKLYEEH